MTTAVNRSKISKTQSSYFGLDCFQIVLKITLKLNSLSKWRPNRINLKNFDAILFHLLYFNIDI